MDIQAYIASGILENYCMGFCSAEEESSVEENAVLYPRIAKELNEIRAIFEEYILANKITPSISVKIGVMAAIYRQLAKEDESYFPLMDSKENPVKEIENWLLKNGQVAAMSNSIDNMQINELPSTSSVINLLVSVKDGHETELHTDFNEFIYVIDGSCTMYFADKPVSFTKGQVIAIPPGIPHHAVITSAGPMVAVVQRQMCI